MVRRSHVATEFIFVLTGNGHYASNKLVVVRHNAHDRGALPHMCNTGILIYVLLYSGKDFLGANELMSYDVLNCD